MQQSERIFARDEERMRHFRNLCDCTLASLQNMENKADSPEERLKISGQMLEIVRLVDTANARQIQIEKRECERTDRVVKGVAMVGGTAVAIGLIYALCKAFSNGSKDEGADISSEDDPSRSSFRMAAFFQVCLRFFDGQAIDSRGSLVLLHSLEWAHTSPYRPRKLPRCASTSASFLATAAASIAFMQSFVPRGQRVLQHGAQGYGVSRKTFSPCKGP